MLVRATLVMNGPVRLGVQRWQGWCIASKACGRAVGRNPAPCLTLLGAQVFQRTRNSRLRPRGTVRLPGRDSWLRSWYGECEYGRNLPAQLHSLHAHQLAAPTASALCKHWTVQADCSHATDNI